MLRLASIPLALMALVLAALLWSSGGRPPKKAEFTFINRGDIITLDLNLMSYQQDFRLTYAIREGLYGPHFETFEPEPAGAERHEVSPDGRVWTFHLRKNAKWSNGDPVTAHDYVFSWRRFLEEPGEYTYLFYYVKNAKAYEDQCAAWYAHPRKRDAYAADPLKYVSEMPAYADARKTFEVSIAWVKDPADQARRVREFEQEQIEALKPQPAPKPEFSQVGVEAVDDYTFRVTLNDPVTFLLDLIAFPPFYPRNERSMQAFKEIQSQETGQYTFRNEYTRPPHVVTNGPYNLTRWDFKRTLWLEKSQTYWDRDNVKVNSIESLVNENVLSQFLQYEAGVVDWLADIPPALAADLRARNRTDLRASKAFGTAFLTLMCRDNLPPSILGGAKNPLADQRVREALAMAIDKKFIVEKITRMGEEVATTYFPPGTLPGFDVLPGLAADPGAARAKLAEAGYPGGKGFPSLPILYNSDNPIRANLAQALKEQWKRVLGIDVEIQSLEVKIYRNRVTEKEYAIALAAWYGDYPDVSTFTDKYHSTSLQNDSAWENKEFDSLLAQAAKESDVQKRMSILQRAEKFIDTEVPIIPLYHYVNCSMRREYVKGISENPRNLTVFKGLHLDKQVEKVN